MTQGNQPSGDAIVGIVFDAVGTLIEPSTPVATAYADAAGRQGIPLEAEVVRGRFLRAFRADEEGERRGGLTTDEANERRRWRRIVAEVLPEVPDPGLAFDELWEWFGQSAAWTCFPDVAPALERIKAAGLRIAIASNFDGRLHAIVDGLEPLSGRVDATLVSSELRFRKPHHKFYDAVSWRLGRPSRALLCVGDDLENDVRGAVESGFRAIWLDRRGDREVGGVERIRGLESLPGRLGNRDRD